MTTFDIDLLESDSEIARNILVGIQNYLSKAFTRIPDRISNNIKNIVSAALKAEPEYTSLTSGKLRYEFGIENISNVDKVIDLLVNTLNISVTPITASSRAISGGFKLTMMKSDDLNGVINATEAYIVDDDRGYKLPWLQWLLLEGNSVIVSNYEVKIGSNPRSRTGNAIMVTSKKNWRVPTEFVGTQTNNWTTRAIDSAETAILSTIEQAVKDIL